MPSHYRHHPTRRKSPSFVALAQIAKDTGAFIIGGSVPECDTSGNIYNTCAMHLFDMDVPGGMSFHESDTLSAGKKTTTVDLEGYGQIGLGVCYDMRFAELSTIAARQGAFALVYPSAFNTTTGPLHWELLGRARAVDNQGYGMVTDPMGQVVAGTNQSEDIAYALLHPETIKRSRMAIPITFQRRHDVYPDIGKLVQT
ncbi:hypothetical protein CA14_008243 [Aspergillus flavus]|uniref:CN hydrolase domain-containing protein n=1 Tax=Aspergillus flavus TaxID=5059 RepID=A0AB74CMY2_ASPFL|nr:hypothetical protein CA14_008243 [Aspergillus flavus]